MKSSLKDTLAKDWKKPLEDLLHEEKEHFEKLNNAMIRKKELLIDGPGNTNLIDEEIEKLLDTIPPQVQLVWDNINLRTKHRFERGGDKYDSHNYDWMASLFIKDRINANHMDGGAPVKLPDDLKIEDFVPSQTEKDYIFQSLVHYFSSRVTERYPNMFKSVKPHIKSWKPHQFQEEMNRMSQELTGDLYTKSESNTDDLIDMMAEFQQKYVHVFENEDGSVNCYEKKILSGDNKTEKNQTYGIMR